MHNVEEEGKKAQQNQKQGGKRRKQSSIEAHPSKKGEKFNCKKIDKSLSKSESGINQVGLEILVKGRYQNSNMVNKCIIIWANSPLFYNEKSYFTCTLMKNMVKCFQKLTY